MKNYLIISPYIKLVDIFLNNLKSENEVIIKYDSEIDRFDNVLEEAGYSTLFNDKKLILVKNYNQINDEELINYLKNPSPEVSIIIWTTKKLDERRKGTKELKKLLEIIDYSLLDEKELLNLTKSIFEKEGKKIKNDALNLILQKCINNYDLIVNECEKLIINSKDDITVADVEMFVSTYIEDNIFALKDTIVNKDMTLALKQFEEFILNKEDVLPLISLLEKEYKLIYIVKNTSYDEFILSSKLKVHSYPVKLARGKINKYTNMELENNLLYLADLDINIKSGKVDKNEGFRQFIIYSGGKNE